MEKNSKDFEIGLVLAGAVSAGAYTAGVMDFLIEALDEWNRAKDAGESVPKHNVRIKVIAGASAGGMTAAMTAVEIRRRATKQIHQDDKSTSSFYKAWVDMIDIKALLNCDDLKGKKTPVLSLLNSSIVDKIANEIIKINDGVWRPLPYVTKELKIYLALSNLRGIPYKFDLAGESGFPYEMMSHADYQYVEINGSTPEKEWEKLKSAAMATGAFPIGLSARIIQRTRKEYEKRLANDGLDKSKLMELGDEENFDFVAVDGGLLNNEPIEWAKAALFAHEKKEGIEQDDTNKKILKALSEQKAAEEKKTVVTDANEELKALKEKKGRTTNNAIIMVDPFPNINQKTYEPKQEDIGLFNILGPIISAMRSQCMLKPEELLLSTSEDVFDRFLIAPIRSRKDDANVIEKNPLASGFFEGFGGFMSYDFRKHDYHLGRRNCQQFLKYYFAIPEEHIRENEIFKDKIIESYFVTPPQKKTASDDVQTAKRYPIIPLVGKMKVEEPTMDWPAYSQDEFNTFKKLLAKRINCMVSKALPLGSILKWIWLILLGLFIAVGVVHFYQHLQCSPSHSCASIVYFYAVGISLIEFILMMCATAVLIFAVAVHVIQVWAKMKVIEMIERYLKQYNLDIK